MFFWLFRRDKLCPGTHVCGEAQVETAGEEPCAECPNIKLDLFLTTLRGRQLAIVIDLDRDHTQAGLTYGPHDLTYLDLLLMRLLAQERDAYTEELMNNAKKGK